MKTVSDVYHPVVFKDANKINLNVQIWLECPTSTNNLHSAAVKGGGIGQKRETMDLRKDFIIYAIDSDPSPTQFRLLAGKFLALLKPC